MSSRRVDRETGMRIIPGTCRECSAQVSDLYRHRQWHLRLDARLPATPDAAAEDDPAQTAD